MSLISFTPLQDGVTGVNAAATNNPLNTIYDDYNGNITDANIASNAAIATSKLALGNSWTSYTPSWTNVSVGNATVNFQYSQLGKTVIVRGSFIVGSTTGVTGSIIFTLPVTSISYPGTANTQSLGVGNIYDTSASTLYDAGVLFSSTTTARLIVFPANGTWVTVVNADNTNPVGPNTGDEWNFELIYQVA